MCSLDRFAYDLYTWLIFLGWQHLKLSFAYITNTFFLTVLQGVLGIKVKIMLDWDPKGKQGPKTPLPDIVTIHTPKEEEEYVRPAAVVANDIEVPVPVAVA